ncbi:MAG TPA: hypothetical protein VFO85_10640 [Vicinamibacteria bacterium]|nr:hypothetical protein [Vicinamibacteria bacterium]
MGSIISVAGACSRAGKTALAVSMVGALGPGTAAVKFTTTEDVFERCPRGTTCIVCDIDVPFRIVEDPVVLDRPGTDTQRLREAGAAPVVWAIARGSSVAPAWAAVRGRVAAAPVVVMEGSTIVHTARPGLTAFVVHPFLSPERWKRGSEALIRKADVVVVNRPSAERRAPALSVLRAIERARPQGPVLTGDVLLPLAEWAPGLDGRVRAAVAAEVRA